METIDTRGLSCPEPVILAKQAMRRIVSGKLNVLVDAGAPHDNVTRAAELSGWTVIVEELPNREFCLTISK